MQRVQLDHSSPCPAGNSGNGNGGSILVAESPMRTFGGPHSNTPPFAQKFDLTPRVQNTSAIFTTGGSNANNSTEDKDPLDFDLEYLDDMMEMNRNSSNDDHHEEGNHKNVVTPEGATAQQGFLPHGEHLAFPTKDLHDRPLFSARPMHPGAVLPPLASRGLLPMVKKSGPAGGRWNEGAFASSRVNHNNDAVTHHPNANLTIHRTTIPAPLPCTRAPEFAHFPPMEDPVPFPPAGGSHSFTCMEQYEKRRHLMRAHPEGSHMSPTTSPTKTNVKKPYQPSRRGVDDEDDILPAEELDRIFTPRRGWRAAGTTSLSTRQDDDDDDDDDFIHSLQQRHHTHHSTGGPDEDETHQSLFPAIPLEERQWSIPSIRMAHHVNGSVASFTTYTDEDDESLLMMYRDSDDASLSSLGSYSNHYTTTMMIGGGDDEILKNRQSPFVVSLSTNKEEPKSCFLQDHNEQPMAPTKLLQQQHIIGIDSLESEENENMGENINNANTAMPSTTSKYQHQRRRQKRQEQRDRSAYEWLKTVTAGNDEVAEAASSKFLTGRTNSRDDQDVFTPSADNRRPLMKRLSVTAGIESKTLAALTDLEKHGFNHNGNGNIITSESCGGGGETTGEDTNLRHAISADR